MTEADDPTLAVAQDLRAIVELSATLEDQAAHKAGGEMPGGDALVCLGPVASPEAWQHRVDTIERLWWARDDTDPTDPRHWPNTGVDEDPSWEPPLQTLLFWSEAWRWEHDSTSDLPPTVESEAAWLGQVVQWAYDHEPHWDDFAKDVASARRRLEAVLYAGEREERSRVPCIDCELDRDGAPLRVMLIVHYGGRGADDHWACPRCRRRYDEAALRRAEYHDLHRRGLDRHVLVTTAAQALDVPRSRLTPLATACDVSSRALMVHWLDCRHMRRAAA